MEDILPYLIKAFVYGIPVITAITFHEVAHGFVALLCGDTTAQRMGRLTLNPVRHVDPFGTLLLPGLLIFSHAPFVFGYAKPVPVQFSALNNPRGDSILVALAGPLTNILLAFLSAALFYASPFFSPDFSPVFEKMLQVSLTLNVTLAVFNMIPLLPLDGGRVLMGLLPPSIARYFEPFERWGIVIVFSLFFLIPTIANHFGYTFTLFNDWLFKPIHAIVQAIAVLFHLV